MEVVNLLGNQWTDRRDRPGWRWNWLGVGDRLGGELIGASLYELEPGQKTFPYHFHVGMEEWLLVVSGRPTLRTPEGERALEPGDVVAFPRGPDGAHQVRNETDEPARLLMLSSEAEYEIAVYPDSDKIGALSPVVRKLFPADAAVDYFEGEE